METDNTEEQQPEQWTIRQIEEPNQTNIERSYMKPNQFQMKPNKIKPNDTKSIPNWTEVPIEGEATKRFKSSFKRTLHKQTNWWALDSPNKPIVSIILSSPNNQN